MGGSRTRQIGAIQIAQSRVRDWTHQPNALPVDGRTRDREPFRTIRVVSQLLAYVRRDDHERTNTFDRDSLGDGGRIVGAGGQQALFVRSEPPGQLKGWMGSEQVV